MLVIAHRGASGLEPENTIRSFKKAQEFKIDMIEMDIRETLDGHLIAHHDHNLKRLFNVRKHIALATLDELKEISRAAGKEIPTLAEALREIGVPIILDVKVHGIEQKVMDHIKNFSPKVLISSTYPKVLKKFRALDEKIDLALVIGKGELHLLPLIHFLTHKLNLYSIHPKYVLANALTIAGLRTVGKKIHVWTVNEQHEYERMKKLTVDGIFTDCPHLYA